VHHRTFHELDRGPVQRSEYGLNWTDGLVQRSAFLERIECVQTCSNVFERCCEISKSNNNVIIIITPG